MITYDIMRQYQLHNKQPTDYLFVGPINDEVLNALILAPSHEHKEKYLHQALDQVFSDTDWTQSFTQPMIIIWDEVIFNEMILALHSWLRTKAANIENIHVLMTHHLGVSTWWKNYCEVMQIRSFDIIESWFCWRLMHRFLLNNTGVMAPISWDEITEQKLQHIDKLFSFYCGEYSRRERDYLLISLLRYNTIAMMDSEATLMDFDSVLAYTENISYFMNQSAVDEIREFYPQHVKNNKLVKNPAFANIQGTYLKDECFNFKGMQWEIDKQCFATVIRETHMDECYISITEKTLRAFLHGQIPIPVGYCAVELLEQEGFRFPTELIDYSYQYEPNYHYRVQKIKQQLDKLAGMTASEWKQCFLDSQEILKHNYDTVVNLEHKIAMTIYDVR